MSSATAASEPANEQPVVEIDRSSCGTAETLPEAEHQAASFLPDLSAVLFRRPGAVVYSSQPVIRAVPADAFFRCPALANSAARLGRFSLRLQPAGWTLTLGECVTGKPPASPNARVKRPQGPP